MQQNNSLRIYIALQILYMKECRCYICVYDKNIECSYFLDDEFCVKKKYLKIRSR